MSTTPIVYRSSDASAPVLTGLAGSLVAVLDACLVNGYGTKAAAGWTKAFTAANQASYRQGAGNQFYLDVDDRGASGVLTGASGLEAAVRGYEAMTALSTGTNPFPTTVQVAAATANWRKSVVAGSQPVPWCVIADDRTFHILIQTRDNIGPCLWQVYCFGDVYSLKSGDSYRTGITVRTVVNASGVTGQLGQSLGTTSGNTVTGYYLARVQAGTGASINAGLLTVGASQDATGYASAAGSESPDGNAYLARFLVGDAAIPYWRGWLRGVWHVLTPQGFQDGDTIYGTGDLAGRQFLIAKGIGTSRIVAYAYETTTWEASS